MGTRNFSNTFWCRLAFAVAMLLTAEKSISAAVIDGVGTRGPLKTTVSLSGSASIAGDTPISAVVIGNNYVFGRAELNPDGLTYEYPGNTFDAPLNFSKAPIKTQVVARNVGMPQASNGTFPATFPRFTITIAGLNSGTLNNLNFDFLERQPIPFTFAELLIPRTRMEANPNFDGDPANGPAYLAKESTQFRLNGKGAITNFYFEQDLSQQSAFTRDELGRGSFSLPGILHTNYWLDFSLGGFEIGTIKFERADPLVLRGNSIIPGSSHGLTGSFSAELPLGKLPTDGDLGPALGMTATIDLSQVKLRLDSTFDFDFYYIPEPGTVVMLLLGMALIWPVVGRARGRSR